VGPCGPGYASPSRGHLRRDISVFAVARRPLIGKPDTTNSCTHALLNSNKISMKPVARPATISGRWTYPLRTCPAKSSSGRHDDGAGDHSRLNRVWRAKLADAYERRRWVEQSVRGGWRLQITPRRFEVESRSIAAGLMRAPWNIWAPGIDRQGSHSICSQTIPTRGWSCRVLAWSVDGRVPISGRRVQWSAPMDRRSADLLGTRVMKLLLGNAHGRVECHGARTR